MRSRLLLSLLAFLPQIAKAALPDSLNAARIRTNQTGLKILLGWGAVNIAAGAVGYATADGEEARRFCQMSAFWGIVNGAIAGFGYRNALREAERTYTPEEAYKKHHRDRRVFLLNAGLDVLYVGAGVYLHGRAGRPAADNPALLRGYGNAVLVQGAFLLLFDAAMYTVHGTRQGAWRRWAERVEVSGNGVGLRLPL